MRHVGLILQPKIELAPPALEGQSLNHWTTREAPVPTSLLSYMIQNTVDVIPVANTGH